MLYLGSQVEGGSSRELVLGGQVFGGSMTPTESHIFTLGFFLLSAMHVPSKMVRFQPRMEGQMTALLQNEQLGCAKTSSRYGEPAEEMEGFSSTLPSVT